MWLDRCLVNSDLAELMKTRYGLQVGMSDLVKKGIVNNAIREMFIRWTRSIEKTARKIIKKKYGYTNALLQEYSEALNKKRKIEQEYEMFLRRSSY